MNDDLNTFLPANTCEVAKEAVEAQFRENLGGW
jgi:hypothetical protein